MYYFIDSSDTNIKTLYWLTVNNLYSTERLLTVKFLYMKNAIVLTI